MCKSGATLKHAQLGFRNAQRTFNAKTVEAGIHKVLRYAMEYLQKQNLQRR